MITKPSYALIADDDEFFRMALGAILTGQLGFDATLEASSLPEALSLLQTHDDIGMALFDLKMPGMLCVESLAAVRDCAPLVPLVIVSGSTERADILSALDLGVHGFISKVAGAAELCRALRLVMGGNVFVPATLAYARSSTPAPPQAPFIGMAMTTHLTQRQQEVLRLLGMGQTNKQIARELGLGAGTVKGHVAAILRALDLSNRAAAAAYAARQPGMIAT